MIKINDKIRISVFDERNLQIEEYRKIINQKTKEERYEWVWCGYYGDLKSAISGVLSRFATQLAQEEINDCKEVLDKLEAYNAKLHEAIKGVKPQC